MKKISNKQREVLTEIQQSIPKEWLDRVTIREDIAPATKEIMELAINDPDVSEEQKAEFKTILNSDFFDQKIDVEEPIVAELIDSYVAKEMYKAVLAKKLPKPKHKVNFEEVYQRYKIALQQYENKYSTN